MTILQALNDYYDRLEGVAPPGWAPVKFGWCVVLDREGRVVDLEDIRDLSGKKPRPKEYLVPRSDAVAKRTSGIAASLLWDKTSYALGRTAGEGRRTAQEHAAFLDLHREKLAGQDDEGLAALRLFLERWRPERLEELPRYTPDLLDQNIMFRLEGERGYLHERSDARILTKQPVGDIDEAEEAALCLITGEIAPPARLHPTIKGVEGAQTSGAALVSFNQDAFTSYGQEQGANAPTGESAAFRYGTALNHLLARDGPNRLRRPVGDATVVFWADAREAKPEAAGAAEALFAQMVGEAALQVTDASQAERLADDLKLLAEGRPAAELGRGIAPGTRFHILGLSPNAARLAVRFWLTDSFDHFAQALSRHHRDLTIEPPPRGWTGAPPPNLLLARTVALGGEFKNIPPLLAGEVMRAVLAGGRYPLTWASAALVRLRAGDDAGTGWHAAAIRAVLNRAARRDPAIPEEGDIPMSLQRDFASPAYQLGRLFAVYELAQRSALGKVNATIRDKYFGAASATPASVFPLIVRGGQSHLAKVRKDKAGWAALIERELEEIHGHLDAALPRSLPLQKQGEFAVGYYHQRAAKLTSDKGEELSLADQDHTDYEGEQDSE